MILFSANNSWNWNNNNSNWNNNNKNNNNYCRSVSEFHYKPIERTMFVDEIPLEQFFKAYYDCRKNKRNTMNALAFEMNYEEELVKLHDEVMERRYEIGKSIAFIVTKPKKREVFAADFRDRIIHHLVMRKLEPYFENVFIEDNYNCRLGKGNSYGLQRLNKRLTEEGQKNPDTYIGMFDMQGFFMSIHKPTLWNMVRDFVNDRYHESDKDTVLYLLEKIILHSPEKNCIRKSPSFMWRDIPDNKSLFKNGEDYGLPIGNLSSQMFANFYMHGLDKMLDSKFVYGRYVDDFYLIGDKKAILAELPKIRKFLRGLNITLHPKKWYLQHWTKGCKFLGGVSKRGRLYAGNRTVHNAFLAIGEINDAPDLEDAAESVSQRLNSYLGYFGQFSSYAIRRMLVNEINGNWFRYIYITNQAKKVVLRKRYRHNVIIKNMVLSERKCA